MKKGHVRREAAKSSAEYLNLVDSQKLHQAKHVIKEHEDNFGQLVARRARDQAYSFPDSRYQDAGSRSRDMMRAVLRG